MTHSGFRRGLVAAWLLLALSACAGKAGVAAVSEASRTADVAAIRAVIGSIQSTFNHGGLDDFMPVFTQDAVLMSQGVPTAVGAPAIRALYEAALGQMDIKVSFNTEEIEVAGDLAYERGTYVLNLSEKGTGRSLGDVHSRHIHIFRRQTDGHWKTWRMMANSAEAAPAPVAAAQ